MVVLMWLVVFLLGVILGRISYNIWKRKNKNDTSAKGEEEPAPREFNYEEGIVNIQRKISLSLKKEHRNGVENLVDKCVEVNYAIQSVDPQEKNQLHSVPGDFQRLVERHLPELIAKFSEISATSESEQVDEFESIVAQLNGDLDTILENIKNRNYVDFANKHGFMKIRYSDKF